MNRSLLTLSLALAVSPFALSVTDVAAEESAEAPPTVEAMDTDIYTRGHSRGRPIYTEYYHRKQPAYFRGVYGDLDSRYDHTQCKVINRSKNKFVPPIKAEDLPYVQYDCSAPRSDGSFLYGPDGRALYRHVLMYQGKPITVGKSYPRRLYYWDAEAQRYFYAPLGRTVHPYGDESEVKLYNPYHNRSVRSYDRYLENSYYNRDDYRLY